jgi:hypothetical protein
LFALIRLVTVRLGVLIRLAAFKVLVRMVLALKPDVKRRFATRTVLELMRVPVMVEKVTVERLLVLHMRDEMRAVLMTVVLTSILEIAADLERMEESVMVERVGLSVGARMPLVEVMRMKLLEMGVSLGPSRLVLLAAPLL